MNNSLNLFCGKTSDLSIKNDTEICNGVLKKFGLQLSVEQMHKLDSDRRKSLYDCGRIEFGEGVIKKLVYAFCDSPYVSSNNFPAVLSLVQDAFYYLKNETGDSLSDDELICAMESLFNGYANGCVEKITDLSVEEIIVMAKTNVFNENKPVTPTGEEENADAEC